jgi:hypothetical protein
LWYRCARDNIIYDEEMIISEQPRNDNEIEDKINT